VPSTCAGPSQGTGEPGLYNVHTSPGRVLYPAEEERGNDFAPLAESTLKLYTFGVCVSHASVCRSKEVDILLLT